MTLRRRFGASFASLVSPIKIKPNKNNPKSPSKLALNYPTKVAAFAAFIYLLDHRDTLHPRVISLIYCALTYLTFEVIFGLINYLGRPLMGIELESPSDEPYLATSLQDFWGRRWNLMVTNILREVVYRPVKWWVGNWIGKRWIPFAAAIGVFAAFVVSGLMHELIFYYTTRAAPTWEVTCFFVLQGVCVVVEYGLKRLLMGKFRLHRVVSGPLTVGFVVATAIWLFFPPIVRPGIDVEISEESRVFVEFVICKFKWISLS